MNEHELRAAVEQLERDADGRRFTDEERKQWNALNEELDSIGRGASAFASWPGTRAP